MRTVIAVRVPTVGRIVMFHSPTIEGSVFLPAIVVKVHSPTNLNLQIFQDRGGDGTVYATSISEGTGPNTWSWPERG